VKRARLRRRGLIFWVWLRRVWLGRSAQLVVVKPETIIKWHRWRWKSRKGKLGRPKVDPEIRALIRRMARENVTWGVPPDTGKVVAIPQVGGLHYRCTRVAA
jgi:hypothetical protein